MHMIPIPLASALFLCLFTFVAGAEPVDPRSGMVPPSQPCRIGAPDVPSDWTDIDRWAWTEICEGRPADFNSLLGDKFEPTNPAHQDKWSDERRMLGPRFLETIFLYEPFRSAIPHRGVHINGAIFRHVIDLQNGEINRPMILKHSAFNLPMRLDHVTTSSVVVFDGSKFADKLRMSAVTVRSNLFMREQAEFDEMTLIGADIGGQLDMSGSMFRGKLTMDSLSVGTNLFMRGQAEFQEVNLRGADIGGQISMDGSTFQGKLTMGSVSVGESLLMGKQAEFQEVDLIGADIGGQLNVGGSRFRKKLTMDSLLVGGNLFMGEQAEFQEVSLKAAEIGGQIDMSGSTFQGKLAMDSVSVGEALFMDERAEFQEVRLVGAKIGGNLSTVGSRFQGNLIMDSISVGQSIFIRAQGESRAVLQEVDLTFSDIGGSLVARGAELWKLNLTGAHVNNDLVLGSPEGTVTWTASKDRGNEPNPPRLTLQNTTVGALQDNKASWPSELQLELEGFTYGRLGGLQASGKEMPHQRGSDWYVAWLARDQSYSPQPYRHLARILNTSGHRGMANDILFASRERERAESGPGEFKWWVLSALQFTIGYGYGWRYFWALVWVAFFTLLGTGILCWRKQPHDKGEKLGFWYSLDMLLPIIRLREKHYEVDLSSKCVRRYFYCHKVIGYVLVFFVIAGLTGLTE